MARPRTVSFVFAAIAVVILLLIPSYVIVQYGTSTALISSPPLLSAQDLKSVVDSMPTLDALMATNTALRTLLEELRSSQKSVQDRIQLLSATSSIQADVIAKSLNRVSPKPAEEKEIREAAWKVLEDCVVRRDRHDAKFKNLTKTWQRWVHGVRESKWRERVAWAIEEIDRNRDWWLGLNLHTAEEAVSLVKKLSGDEEKKLFDFLIYYLPVENIWNASDPQIIAKTAKHRDDWAVQLAGIKADRDALQADVAAEQAALAELCGIHVERSDWIQKHRQVAEHFDATSRDNHYAGYPDCVDWQGVDPGVRARVGIAAPDPLWKQDPALYPNPTVNVTFVLQYYRQPGIIDSIVDRLYKCTNGRQGGGELPGLTSTLLVNVDAPDEFQKWQEKWVETDPGSFLVPVFSHKVHDARGFNKLANVARGHFVFFIQDNDVPPDSCQWLAKALSVFRAWPRAGAVGLRNPRVSANKFDRGGVLGDLQLAGSSEFEPKRLHDPEAGVDMRFASVADVGPLGFRKDVFLELGGFNEGLCKKGNPCSLADWELTLRTWLAGYQVVHVDLADAESFQGWKGSVVPGSYELAVALQNVKINHGVIDEVYKEHRESIVAEVKRLNSHLVVL